MNTTPSDFDVVAERCPYVFGRSDASGGSGEPGPVERSEEVLGTVRNHDTAGDDARRKQCNVHGCSILLHHFHVMCCCHADLLLGNRWCIYRASEIQPLD